MSLIVLVPIIPLAALGSVAFQAPDTWSILAGSATSPVESFEFEGASFGPSRGTFVPDSGFHVPADGTLAAVRVDVEPGDTPPYCAVTALTEVNSGREWRPGYLTMEIDDFNNELPYQCAQLDPDNLLPMIVPFAVPADAAPPFTVTIRVSTDETVELRTLLVDFEESQ